MLNHCVIHLVLSYHLNRASLVNVTNILPSYTHYPSYALYAA